MRKLTPEIISLQQINAMKKYFNLHIFPPEDDLFWSEEHQALFIYRLLTGNPISDLLIQLEKTHPNLYGIIYPNECGLLRRSDYMLKSIWNYFDGLDPRKILLINEGDKYIAQLENDSHVNIQHAKALIQPYNKLTPTYKHYVDNFTLPILWYDWWNDDFPIA